METWFNAIVLWLVRHPRAALVGGFGALVVFSTPLADLKINTHADAFIAPTNPALTYKNYVKSSFGLDDPIVVALEHGDGMVSQPGIAELVRLTDAIRRVDNVDPDAVVSLATEAFVHTDADGVLITDFAELDTPEAYDAAIERFPPVVGQLVSENRQMMLIIVELIDQNLAADTYQQIRALASESAVRLPGLEAHVAGQAAVSAYLSQYIDDDARRVLPLTALVIVLVIWLAFRSWRAVVIAMAVVAGTLVVTFGSMAAFGVPVYLITNGLAAILIGIAVADAVHILNHFRSTRAVSADAVLEDVILKTMRDMWLPISLTTLTTIAGFAGVYLGSHMPPMEAFGLFAMLGVAAAYLFTLCWVPAFLALLPLEARGNLDPVSKVDSVPARLAELGCRRSGRVLSVTSLVLLVSVAGASAIVLNESLISHFDSDEPIVTADAAINDSMAGTNLLDIVVSSDESGGLLNPDVVEELHRLRDYVLTLPSVGGATLFTDLLVELDDAIRVDDATLLDTSAGVAQLLLLQGALGDPTDNTKQIDSTHSNALLRVHLKSGMHSDTEIVIEAVQSYVAKNARGPYSVNLSGRVVLNNHWVRGIAQSHVQSVVISSVLLVVVASVLLRSIALGALTLATVFASVVCVYAVMGFSGVWLNAGTSMFAAIALGLGIDFAIHLISAVRKQDAGHGRAASIRLGVAQCGPALVTNGLALTLGFAVVAVSHVPQIKEFGLLTSAAVFGALLGALVFLPAALSKVLPNRYEEGIDHAEPVSRV